jgi:hypothetical protein
MAWPRRNTGLSLSDRDDATRESLADGARALDAAPGQGSRTALYDTAFAAKQKLQNQLGRDETGSIVLFSRGTDDASRISEQQLLPEFRARVGPKIRVVAVRIGPAPSRTRSGTSRTPPVERCCPGRAPPPMHS